MTGSERILAAYRRTKDKAPEGARLAEQDHAIVYYAGNKSVACFHKNKGVARFAWYDPILARQVEIFVLPRNDDGSDVLDSLWLSLYAMDISTLTDLPPEPQAG